ncbi:hypothetical protein Nans01_42950 [Nocardiopsis ansamitocini]|uniref:Uncharacterized protein n=1 Tax=Nocardiopsis ansamitocini TaxID=1670832 RepID=A0A9W6PAC9_9ACTN|nr:hypothetical protein Nans01_42950 [Nocardiopsis ansamitocini]
MLFFAVALAALLVVPLYSMTIIQPTLSAAGAGSGFPEYTVYVTLAMQPAIPVGMAAVLFGQGIPVAAAVLLLVPVTAVATAALLAMGLRCAAGLRWARALGAALAAAVLLGLDQVMVPALVDHAGGTTRIVFTADTLTLVTAQPVAGFWAVLALVLLAAAHSAVRMLRRGGETPGTRPETARPA